MRKRIEEIEDYIIDLRRYFHMYPEASLKEVKTSEKIEEELNKLNIPNKRIGETGIIGFIGNNKGNKKVALRADIDALEIDDKKDKSYSSKNKGLMHACGHDGHTAMLLGAAKLLKEKEDEIDGEIRLCFQQGEEIGQGARLFVEEGYLDDVDTSFAIHLDSSIDSNKVSLTKGPVSASCDYFKAKIKGKSGHVSRPHEAIDALYIAAESVVNIQSIVSRETDPIDPVIVGIGVLNSGTRYNIIANEAILEGTYRTFSHETRESTKEAIERILTSTATMNRAGVEIEFKDFASPLINDEEATEFGIKIAKKIFGRPNIITDSEKSLGADDFAEFLRKTKGVYARLGSRDKNDKSTHYSHHHEKFDIDESVLKKGTELYVTYALDFLTEGFKS